MNRREFITNAVAASAIAVMPSSLSSNTPKLETREYYQRDGGVDVVVDRNSPFEVEFSVMRRVNGEIRFSADGCLVSFREPIPQKEINDLIEREIVNIRKWKSV